MKRCPKCDSANTVAIRLVSRDGIIAVPEVQMKKLFPKYSKIKAVACTKCGNIFDLTLETPEKFVPFVSFE